MGAFDLLPERHNRTSRIFVVITSQAGDYLSLAGESGTGKTIVAEEIASQFRKNLMLIDLFEVKNSHPSSPTEAG